MFKSLFYCLSIVLSTEAWVVDTSTRCAEKYKARLGTGDLAVSRDIRRYRDRNAFRFVCKVYRAPFGQHPEPISENPNDRPEHLDCPSDTYAVFDDYNTGTINPYLGLCWKPPATMPKIEITTREICENKFRSTVSPQQRKNAFFVSTQVQKPSSDTFLVSCILHEIDEAGEKQIHLLGRGIGDQDLFEYKCPAGTIAELVDSVKGICRDPTLPDLLDRGSLDRAILAAKAKASKDTLSRNAHPCQSLVYTYDDPGQVHLYATVDHDGEHPADHKKEHFYKEADIIEIRQASLTGYMYGHKVGEVKAEWAESLKLPAFKGMIFNACADISSSYVPATVRLEAIKEEFSVNDEL
ncbi:hypothetical protein MRB53_041753 [Persea americana]|nr:hypothetical protein MRB53_041753 [Persea americana]